MYRYCPKTRARMWWYLRLEEGQAVRNWLYIVNPTDTTLDGELSTPERVLERAQSSPRDVWWVAQRRHMAPGDRLWIYFSASEKVVAAMAEVTGAPYEVPGDFEYRWRVPAVLDLAATRALNRAPVPLSALTNQHPQGVTLAKDQGLPLLLERAGL